MTESEPDEIQIESIEDLGDPRVIERMDYIVTGGVVCKVVVNPYADRQHLKRVDEIPEEYWERYND